MRKMNKKKLSFVAIAIMALLTSCASGTGSKMITPTATEFTSGELAEYVEVVNQPTELTFVEKDGDIATQYFQLRVALEMVKDGIKGAEPRDIDFTSLLSVAVINLVDENGIKVQDLSVKSEEMLKLKKLLTGDKGETAEIVFEGVFHNSDDAPKWYKETAQFTPYLTSDVSFETALETLIRISSTQLLTEDELSPLTDNELRILRNSLYAKHGYIFNDQSLTVYFSDYDWYEGVSRDAGRAFRQFTSIEKSNLTFIQGFEKSRTASAARTQYESGSAGSADWDSLLDTYEQYVNKLVPYVEKAVKGDLSALAEYPALMEKAVELNEEIEDAEGEMSTAQMNRYLKITEKMTNAVMKLSQQ